MIVDMHNHTPLCKHATGTPLEYAKKAYENGTKFYGFSDHAPMDFDEKYRMSLDEMKIYKNMIMQTRELFKGKMEILYGYEVDFLQGYIKDEILQEKCDYLIGSVHFIDKWGFDNPEFIGEYKNRNIDEIYKDYFYAIKELAKSNLFDILGHIDLIKVFNFKPKTDIRILAKEAILEIKRSNLVVELNSAGYRKPVGELYPSDEILELLAEHNIPITLSSDAHAVEQVGLNGDKTIKKALEFGYDRVAIFRQREREFVNLAD